MKRIFLLFFISLAVVCQACSDAPEVVDRQDSEEPKEEPDPEPDPKPDPEEPVLRAIAIESEALTLARGGEAKLFFRVEEADYLFDYNPASEACQLSLRDWDEPTQQATEVVLSSVEPCEEAGRYCATVRDTEQLEPYLSSFCLAIRPRQGEECYSEELRIRRDDYTARMTAMRILKSENPSLSEDVEFVLDPATRTFTAHIPNYLRHLQFVARFEIEGEVEEVRVGERKQKSGVTINDYKQELIYTLQTEVGTVDYTVRLTNFTGLPVMWIETPHGQSITSKEVWIEGATIWVDGVGQFEDLAEMELSIRGRGNSTWGYEKKPYNIKLESKKELLGMPKHKRWCLLANYMDRTMLRNRVAYRLAEVTSLDWTPRTRFVELFLNGRHQGCYLLAEHIKVDENRVPITEMEPEDTTPETITGGYLLELDFHFDNQWQWHSAHNIPFAVKYPEEEDLVAEQFAWIKQYITEVEAALYGSAYRDPDQGYAAYIDVQSFVDYWLVYELSVNHELANPGSVYLHKDRHSKLMAGPVWDFDWGTFSYNASPAAKSDLFMKHAWWYGRLFSDEAFKQVAVARWDALKPHFEGVLTFLDEEARYTARSAEENFRLWSISTTINGDEQLPVDEAVARMRQILQERIAIVDREIGEWRK